MKVYQLIQYLAQFPASYEVWLDAKEPGYRLISQDRHDFAKELDQDENVVVLKDYEDPEGRPNVFG